MVNMPAILEEQSPMKNVIPITIPTLPPYEDLEQDLREIMKSGMITNHIFVKRLETEVVRRLGCSYAIALSSCTSGLMLALSQYRKKSGSVILPSFTFSATGHAVVWNGLRLNLVDADPDTFLMDIDRIQESIDSNVCAIIAVHLYGLSSSAKALEDICEDAQIPLIFDAAHALGAHCCNRSVGNFGNVEVFSLSPTKLVVAGEGGIVTTNDKEVADYLHLARNYGDNGLGVCNFSGLNARMSEFHAILAYHSLINLDKNLENRREMAQSLIKKLSQIPGMQFQKVENIENTTYKDVGVIVKKDEFGLSRELLRRALSADGINTKTYFDPPLHKQPAFQKLFYSKNLQVTDDLAQNIINLPMYSHISGVEVEQISSSILSIYEHSKEINKKLSLDIQP